ncbi:MAG: glycosyltransferase family 39 protein [Thermoanaerobaculia bacterium]
MPKGDAAAGPTRTATIPVPEAGTGSGEIGFFDASGRRVRRLTGFGEPFYLSPSADDRFLVTDRAIGRVLELDVNGTVFWSWDCPPGVQHPDKARLLSNGHVLLQSERSATEIDREGNVLWASDPLPPGIVLTGLARLADGSTVFVTNLESGPVLQAAPGGSHPVPLRLDELQSVRLSLRGEPEAAGASAFLLWSHDLAVVHRARIVGDRVVLEDITYPLPLTWTLSSDPRWGQVGISDSFTIRHHRTDGDREFQVPYAPLGALYLPESALYAVSYVRVPSVAWPETWLSGASSQRFPWRRLGLFILVAVAVVGFLSFLRFRKGRGATAFQQPPAPSDVPRPAAAVEPGASPSWSVRARRLLASLLPPTLFIAGIGLAFHGVRLLRNDFQDFHLQWVSFLGGGVLVATVAFTWWRARTHDLDSFWAGVATAPPVKPRVLQALGAGCPVLIAGLVVLYRLRSAPGRDVDATCLWIALHVVLLGMTALAFAGDFRIRWLSRHTALLVPLAAGAVTLFLRLRDVPANIHFDFSYCALSALEFLDGRLPSPFTPGFVPVPVFGFLPEALGLALVGPGEIGFRLGAALAGLTGILAVYILGTLYRGARTGLFAAILLAGALPWIHFSRLPSNGVSAVAGLWMVALFALAVRSGHPGWWLVSGSVAGWCFYLWPSSRVSAVACFFGGLLLAARAPSAARRRWYGPPLMALAFAVWLVPLIPMWIASPNLALPRAQESLEVYKPGEGFHADRLRTSFGRPLANSVGWLFAVPDQSTQGSMSPGLNEAEAALFAVGVGLALAAGFSLNVLLLLYLFLVFLTLGAFAGSPPWYTRLLPSLPVACILAGHAAATLLELLPLPGTRTRAVLTALAAGALLWLSPGTNLPRYIDYEGTKRHVWEPTAIGRRLRTLAPGRRTYLITTCRADWSFSLRERPPRLGEMLPFLWGLEVAEVRDLEEILPLPPGPKAVIVPTSRVAADLPVLKKLYPAARTEDLPNGMGGSWAQILIIDAP